MIEGGVPGGSALFHAGQRRAAADRLTLEANWLETIAADQATMSGVLSGLPGAYAVLHDLNVPGSKGTIDHVVVGPGGAFIVVSRRYGERIDYRDGQLWVGDRSMKSVLDAARVESELMTQSLATPVVPVLVLLDTMMPAATPAVVDGVLVSSDDNVVRVITRGAHTLLTPDKVVAITQRALPMLHTPGTIDRTGDSIGVAVASIGVAVASTGVAVDSVLDRGVRLPAPAPFRATPLGTREPDLPAPVAVAAAVPVSGRKEPKAPKEPKARKERPVRRRSAWSVAAIIVGLCLVAVALGTLARLAWNNDSAPPSPTLAPSTTVAATIPATNPSTIPSTTIPPPTNALPAPVVVYTAVCPGPGVGWEMVPTWPGDIEGLAEYDVEMLITDSWVSIAGWKNAAEETSATLHGQPANASYTIRITAVLIDGSRSINTPTEITAPPTGC